MSRLVGSLHRSISYPAILQNPIPIIPIFAISPPESTHVNTSSGMDSDTNSNITMFHTISQFENSDLETSDGFDNSEPSPSTYSQTPFQSIHTQARNESHSTPSHISQLTTTYSPFRNECSNNSFPDNTQISYELNNLITLKQQLQHPQTLTIHQQSSSITSSNPATTTPSSDYTPSQAQSSISNQSSSSTNRSYRSSKKKFPKHPFPSKHGTAREYINHPDHANTTEFLQLF